MNQDIINFLNAAMECSIFISPTDPGLTNAEIHQIGQQAEYLSGEIADALNAANPDYIGKN